MEGTIGQSLLVQLSDLGRNDQQLMFLFAPAGKTGASCFSAQRPNLWETNG